MTAHMCQDAWLDAMTRYTGRPAWRKRAFHSLAGWFERRLFGDGGRGSSSPFPGTSRMTSGAAMAGDGVRVIYHGVDTEVFHPRNRAVWRPEVRRQIGVTEETLLALYVGDYQKGLTPAIQATARVPGLHLVGVGPSPVEPYQKLIRGEKVADRIHLMPATRNVERYYAAADFLVFPTFYDPFGLVATEAMASGLPVVCSAAAGAAELITDGVNGLVVQEPWNPDVLCELLRRLAADPALRRRLGEAARPQG